MFPFLEGVRPVWPVQTVWAPSCAWAGVLRYVCGVRVVWCNLSRSFLADRQECGH